MILPSKFVLNTAIVASIPIKFHVDDEEGEEDEDEENNGDSSADLTITDLESDSYTIDREVYIAKLRPNLSSS